MKNNFKKCILKEYPSKIDTKNNIQVLCFFIKQNKFDHSYCATNEVGMDKSQLIDYCLSKQGGYLDFPFAGDDYAVIKIKNDKNGKYRIFAEIFLLSGRDCLTFSADEETAFGLRIQFADYITKGYHCPPVQAKYKSTAPIEFFDDDMLKSFVDLSYDYAKRKLKID